jgi:hypothetical protein
MDQFNTGMRHQMDHCTGSRYDIDGQRHLAKAAWRILAALELDIEAEQAACQADTTPNTSNNTRKPQSKSKSEKLETRPDTTSSAPEKSTKATVSMSTIDALLRRVEATNQAIGE